MKRLVAVLFWSIIAAAFIGPGTVTSAASAGADHGYLLLWALVFSTFACLVLQEGAARLTIVSGRNLGQALRARYPRGWQSAFLLVLVCGAVILGCAAYEAGNILGGVAGAVLALPLTAKQITWIMVAIAAVLLWFNSPRRVAYVLSILVATMGVAFLWTAIRLRPAVGDLLAGGFRPSVPEDSSLLVIALIGTTVVPYNLFLGSGLARGQALGDIRFGLTVAVIVGGLISMGVLVVGAALEGPFAFSSLSDVLASRLGPSARSLFAAGLFAAGLSSAVTAPLAAAMTARSLFAGAAGDGRDRWSDTSLRFRCTWAGVLAVGLVFGLAGASPVPVIILAQAFNGLLLPLVTIFLLVAVNDKKLMGDAVNRKLSNIAMAVVTLITLLLGATNLWKAFGRLIDRLGAS